MQNKVQLYIENQRVDLFSDETIEVNSSIQDFKDIGKIFTTFSQNFDIPASSNNNKIFSHFYNFNMVEDGAYDPRSKKDAHIEINHLPFREGKINLNQVKMRDNKPYSYDITFYGKTVTLKDVLADKYLSDLSETSVFTSLEHNYDDTTVKGGFETGITYDGDSSALIYPLITPEKRLFYHSGNPSFNSDGNLYGDTTYPGLVGLSYTDLKPAIKCKYILDAIEEGFPSIKFTRDSNGDLNKFFGSTAFSNLYLWLSSNKGNIRDYFSESETGVGQKIVTKLDNFSPSGNDLLSVSQTNEPLTVDFTRTTVSCAITQDDSNNDSQYTVKIIDTTTNELLASKTDNGDTTVSFSFRNTSATIARDYSLKFLVETRNAADTFTGVVTVTTVETNVENPVTDTETFNANSGGSITPNLEIIFDVHLPRMKILDFLTGLFKMFNLTGYIIEDLSDPDYGKLYIDTLDNFYADAVNNNSGGTLDFTKYIDISSHTVGATTLYKRIDFKFEETDSVLMSQHLSEFDEVFGDSEYEPEGVDFGEKYDIQLPFSKLKYERLVDLNDESLTEIQWGYAAGGDFSSTDDEPPKGDYDPIDIKPLLFYGIRETGITDGINWIYNSADSTVTNYWRPSNSNEEGTSSTPPSFTINFDAEFDEFLLQNFGTDDTNSLFNKFYKKYVESVFNYAKRVFRFTAYLPASVLINYKLNDQIKIGDKIFRINSISTDIVTGKSDIELLNIFSDEIV